MMSSAEEGKGSYCLQTNWCDGKEGIRALRELIEVAERHDEAMTECEHKRQRKPC